MKKENSQSRLRAYHKGTDKDPKNEPGEKRSEKGEKE